MTTQQLAPPAPSTALHTDWYLYLYDGRAFLTFDGRVQATATCSTPREEARLIALLDRLTIRSARCSY